MIPLNMTPHLSDIPILLAVSKDFPIDSLNKSHLPPILPPFSRGFSHGFPWCLEALRMVDTAVDTAAGHGARMKLAGESEEFSMAAKGKYGWYGYGYMDGYIIMKGILKDMFNLEKSLLMGKYDV